MLLDDVWVRIWWLNFRYDLNPAPIDANRDGLPDNGVILDSWWMAANDTVTARIRRMMPPGKILVGNGGNPFYQMNGAVIEHFPMRGVLDPDSPLDYAWNYSMFDTYGYFVNEDNYSAAPMRLNIVDSKWSSGDRYGPVVTPEFERKKRFCMASTMLRDGYFAMARDPGFSSIWWMPEFDKPIGTPLGAPYQFYSNGLTLWRRDYSDGVILVNPNYTTYLGSPAGHLPPVGWLDGAVLLTGELWEMESVPPDPIVDLSVVRSWTDAVELQWTNVGDDGMAGQAVAAEIRYSTSPIDEANWFGAWPLPGHVVPELPGLVQKQIAGGLASGQPYHFGIKVRDMSANWGALSNIVGATTIPSDSQAPAIITDLTTLTVTATEVTFHWTATGDDGTAGVAAQFDLRYRTQLLSDATWDSALQVVDEPTPGPAGTPHSLLVYGLTPNTTYYAGIKAWDEMPHASPLSNVVVVRTLPGDNVPPGNIADLRVTHVGSNTLTVSWSSPGDDDRTGFASDYDMRGSPFPITAQNFQSAGFIIGEPSPTTPGATQSMTISGLGTGYDYWLAIRASDERGNWLTMSNVAFARTNVADDVPPAAVTGLSEEQATGTSVTLSWLAPGDDGGGGRASSYELRYATTPLTAESFGTATLATWVPLPDSSGTVQSHTIGDLTTGVTWYFALRAADEMSNWSDLSNVLHAVPRRDLTPPSPPAGLAVIHRTESTITLAWQAPGDDGLRGRASQYDVRWARTERDASRFRGATRCRDVPVPGPAGGRQAMTIAGLSPGTACYFVVRAGDEVPNWSASTPVVMGATLIYAVESSSDSSRTDAASRAAPPCLVVELPRPNPFPGSVGFTLGIPRQVEGAITVEIFDVRGRSIRRLTPPAPSPGYAEMAWDGLDDRGDSAPSGIYFVVASNRAGRAHQKLVLTR